jgi:hypothetical protein
MLEQAASAMLADRIIGASATGSYSRRRQHVANPQQVATRPGAAVQDALTVVTI